MKHDSQFLHYIAEGIDLLVPRFTFKSVQFVREDAYYFFSLTRPFTMNVSLFSCLAHRRIIEIHIDKSSSET